MGPCINPGTDCPPPMQCFTAYTCPNGFCKNSAAPSNTPAGPNIFGDCKKTVCDGSGGTTTVADPMDVPMPMGPCTTPACAGMTPYYMPTNVGGQCGGPGYTCDSMGQCNQCHDLVIDGGETGIDCGGPQCGGCLGAPCNANTQCAHGMCVNTVCN
jgi:hypothetical protein